MKLRLTSALVVLAFLAPASATALTWLPLEEKQVCRMGCSISGRDCCCFGAAEAPVDAEASLQPRNPGCGEACQGILCERSSFKLVAPSFAATLQGLVAEDRTPVSDGSRPASSVRASASPRGPPRS